MNENVISKKDYKYAFITKFKSDRIDDNKNKIPMLEMVLHKYYYVEDGLVLENPVKYMNTNLKFKNLTQQEKSELADKIYEYCFRGWKEDFNLDNIIIRQNTLEEDKLLLNYINDGLKYENKKDIEGLEFLEVPKNIIQEYLIEK
jgi:hypothetical protein